jgi:hypothetical protein
VKVGRGSARQTMSASHLITLVEVGWERYMAGYEFPNQPIRITIQKIERAQIGLHGTQSVQSLIPGAGSRPLMWQDDPLRPIRQTDTSHQPSPNVHHAPLIELMVVDVDHRRGVAAEYALIEPASVPLRRPGVVVAGAEVDALYLTDTELGSLFRPRDDVVRWGNERADGTGLLGVKANTAQGTNVSHVIY